MEKPIRSSAAVFAVALLLGAATPAAGWTQQAAAGQGGGPSPEQVLTQMHMANLMMIRLGELAEQKGVNPLVRRMGDREARDHRFGDKRVTALAQKMGIELPPELPSPGQGPGAASPGAAPGGGQGQGGGEMQQGTQQGGPMQQNDPMQMMMQMAQKLQQAPPEQFDAQYLQAMEQMHQQVVGRLEKARSGLGKDSPLGSLIGKLGPILNQHHDLAAALKDDVGVTASAATER
jgi:predicted outer membrane protein